MKFTTTLLNAPIVFFIICYPLVPVLSWYTVNHINVKTPTLIAYFSTKEKILQWIDVFSLQLPLTIMKNFIITITIIFITAIITLFQLSHSTNIHTHTHTHIQHIHTHTHTHTYTHIHTQTHTQWHVHMLQSLQETAKHSATHSILNSAMFTSLTKESMCRIKDIHSWRFYFACGMRLLLVGLGVSLWCSYYSCVYFTLCLLHSWSIDWE